MTNLYEVSVNSLESWAAEFQDQAKWGECLERMPSAMLDEWTEVVAGRAALKTPVGRTWWVPVSGSIMEPRITGDTAAALVDYVIDHTTATEHIGGNFPILFFDLRTLDPTRVFCCACKRFINASEDAKLYDGKEDRGWDE